MYVIPLLVMDFFTFLTKEHFLKGGPNLRRDPVNRNTGADVVVEVLVVVLYIRLKAIFRKSVLFQELIPLIVQRPQLLLVVLVLPVERLDLLLNTSICLRKFHFPEFFQLCADHSVINLPSDLKTFRKAVFLPLFQPER